MSMKRKDLLGMADLDRTEIEEILTAAVSFKEVATRDIKKVPTLRGRTVVNLFFEPSTRTQISFELAAKRLSADVVTVSAKTSSVAKGESLLDTARNLEAMKADLMVLRHSDAGAPHLLARHLSCGVINAGDGMHEHPTQALLDLYTIREKKERIAGLTVAIIGDIAHSRVARSAINGLTTLGATVRVVGPATMIPQGIERLGTAVCHTLDEGLAGADVVMALRLQLERHGDDHGLRFPSVREYARLYGITRERLKVANPDVLVLHPGPINRGIELSPEVADGVASGILEQVTNGIAVRMAVLYLFVGRAQG